jgi:hypothetical protein
MNPNITFDSVKDNPDKHWDWHGLSMNPNITFDIVHENIDKPWDYGVLSMNPKITFEIVHEHIDKPWNWNKLSAHRNMFLLSSMDLCDIIKINRAAKAIQRHWRHVVTNPYNMVCKRRLLREFKEMV